MRSAAATLSPGSTYWACLHKDSEDPNLKLRIAALHPEVVPTSRERSHDPGSHGDVSSDTEGPARRRRYVDLTWSRDWQDPKDARPLDAIPCARSVARSRVWEGPRLLRTRRV